VGSPNLTPLPRLAPNIASEHPRDLWVDSMLDLFRAIVESSADLIAALDPELRVLAVNAAMAAEAQRLLGLQARAGDRVEELFAALPQDRHMVVELCRRVLGGEELRVTRELGDPRLARRTYEACLVPLRDPDGAIVALSVVAREVTKRVRLEDELLRSKAELERRVAERTAQALASEERLALAQRIGRIGVFDWDASNGAMIWTEELEDLFGLAKGEFEGTFEAWLRRLHPGDAQRLRSQLDAWMRARQSEVSFEYRFTRADQQERWMQATARYSYDGAGSPLRMVGIAVDITERRRFELELRERTAEFERLFEASSDGIVMSELMTSRARGTFLRANPAASALLGYSAEELRQLTPLDILAPEERGAASLEGRELRRGQGLLREMVLVRKDGVRVFAEVASRHFEHRGHAMVMSVIRDLTERRRSERALHDSQARLRSLIDHAPAAIFFKDLEGRLIVGNRRMAALFGRSLDAMLGKTEQELYPELAAQVRVNDQRVLAEGRPLSFEELVPLGDEVHTFMATKFPLRGPGGAIEGLGGISVDITERKRAEDCVREADRRKTEFLAMLSHELRNPLAPIRNSLFVLDRAPPSSPVGQRARAVLERQVGHLTRLVDDLLDVTRISNGKIRLQLERLDFGALLRRTVDDHRSVFTQSGVALDMAAPLSAVWVEGDATRLSQVVGNLLQNAAKFTSRGGATEVWLQVDESQGRAVLSVCDDGIGIAPPMLARLFEPFAQADASLARSHGGLGLGLALVKGLLEMHGGQVSATSAGLGRGAQFVTWLPLSGSAVAADACAPPPALASRRVLVIEDNADAAESLRDLLSLRGHRVEVALTGRRGIEVAREFRPEVVLCDIGLPELDGLGVARAIRADPALAGARLIAVSGYCAPEDQRSALEAGFERHLAKPLTLAHLDEVLAASPT
jgi:PAS domain S-box-containing protein